MSFCGQLSGLSRRSLIERTRDVLTQTGMWHAADRPVRHLSKGMLQRVGLAAALVADPELLILDEPMSGLDPVGRKEVRDLILEESRLGRTIFFSSHILSDVESLCDHVTILRQGKVVVSGQLSQLLKSDVERTDITLGEVSEQLRASWQGGAHGVQELGERTLLFVEGRATAQKVLKQALDARATIISVHPHHETLEELFVREAIDHSGAP